MEDQAEKVYVAIGTTDIYDGFMTLQWTLKKWSNDGISIVILHAPSAIRKDYVYTLLGKFPASSVSEEKLKFVEKNEEAQSDRILSQYIAFCGGVKAEVVKIEENEQPLHKQLVEAISRFHITKLVISLAFMKSSSWKSRSAISGSFYVLREKPDFCELFIICGGRLVFLKEENDEGFIEDDKGFMVAKLKERNHSIKNWFGKMFLENSAVMNSTSPDSSSSLSSNGSPHHWEKYSLEIEQYANELLSLQEEEGKINVEKEASNKNSTEQLDVPEHLGTAERIKVLKSRIQSAQETIQLNRKQANAAKERRKKAESAISICNTRAEELHSCINEQVVRSIDINKESESQKEELHELENEVQEKRSKLNSILELQRELSNKLHLSSSAKACAEVQLEKAVRTRAEMVQQIEELRKYKDVLQRRIEFCREKDAIGKVSKFNGHGLDYREFSAAEIIAATEDFSERLRLKSAAQWTHVYKGRINHVTVAIKKYNSEAFATKVKLFSLISHPNVVAMIGFCSELNCIVYEYLHNRSLHDLLFSTEKNCKRKKQFLSWHARIRIAAEICSALSFLHKSKPMPIIHGNLKPSKILLDCNNIAKLTGFKGPSSQDKPAVQSDIQAFGNLVLQLLSGKNWVITMDTAAGISDSDHLDGEWPIDLAMEFSGIAVKSSSITTLPTSEINDLKKRADELVANGDFHLHVEHVEDLSNMPSAFLCPIYQDIMKNPHLAADGFSYEFEAIDEWLKSGHDTSPMTNLSLKHKLLTPNHALRFLIQDWQNKTSATAT
ncbi:Non-specific serine/threonine protein kinase [Handroanthus impetiginosus]|uniref:RING-type E3 ubiquitin transferase n=1 Tax=Handroanthus impetiginosus TaxID=429701 RepID=A0A2G9HP11_9LAMI|nr:Non-specific serine/threonine protein kinase [Handroanthus impetiginosus]